MTLLDLLKWAISNTFIWILRLKFKT